MGVFVFIYWIITLDLESIQEKATKRIDRDNQNLTKIEITDLAQTENNRNDLERKLFEINLNRNSNVER